LDSKTARHFFLTYPSPDLLVDVDEKALTQELKKANKSIRKNKAKEILNAVHSAGHWENEYQDERNGLIRSYINSLNRFIKEIEQLEEQLDLLITETGYPLQTINGVDTVLAATFIANISGINRFKSANKVAKIAGVAPIEHSSGETSKQYANKIGNRDLNTAFYSLALTQIRKDINPIMYQYYQKKIKEGRKRNMQSCLSSVDW
jgi:transposase